MSTAPGKKKTTTSANDVSPASRPLLLVDTATTEEEGPRGVTPSPVESTDKAKTVYFDDIDSDDDDVVEVQPPPASLRKKDDHDDEVVVGQVQPPPASLTTGNNDSDDDDAVQVQPPPASLKKKDDDDDVVMVKVQPPPASLTTGNNDDEDDVVVVVESPIGAAASNPQGSKTEEQLMAESQAKEKAKAQDEIRNQKELDRMFDSFSRDKFHGLDPYRQPEGFKDDVELHDHQKDGVRWLLHQENHEDQRQCPFFKRTHRGGSNNSWWFNTITRRLQKEDPVPDRGSILADDMGLGKTIQTIALILTNTAAEEEGAPRATLLVCPVSVIAAWQFQVDKFVKEGYCNVEVYSGPERSKVLNRIKRKNDVDILITSYETLMSDFTSYTDYMEEKEQAKEEAKAKRSKKKKSKSQSRWVDNGRDSEDDWSPDSESDDSGDDDDHYLPAAMTRKRGRGAATRPSTWIFQLAFHRVVCDEGHKIRNAQTKMSKACCAIISDRRLLVTGTPFVNKPSDIQALLCFLNAGHKTSNPLVDPNVFEASVTTPIRENKLIGLSRVRLQMGISTLRRTKNLVDLSLPPKTVSIVSVPFPEEGFHTEVHQTLYKVARETFLHLLAADPKEFYRSFYQFFALVMRIRQSCNDATLVPKDAFDRAKAALGMLEESDEVSNIRMDEEEAKKLLSKLLEVLKPPTAEVSEECCICLEQIEKDTAVALRNCSHVFCSTCLLQTPQQKCPLCREPYKAKDKVSFAQLKNILEKQQEQRNKDKAPVANDKDEQAPKITALLEKIDEMKPDESAIIFSQWTSYLDIIEEALHENGHTTCRIDGTVSAEGRLEAMKALENSEARFCLISLMAGGVGITLTRANVAFMMDPWWNSALQDQAMDRCHRIGQTRPVRVYEFAMVGSLEERMYRLQEAKTALGNGSLRKLTAEDKKKARITALKDLFEVDKADTQWRGYHEDDDDDGSLGSFVVGDDIED